MFKSMRVRNLRGFGEAENSFFLDIKPITVFVGKNSSGKSSFLRTLPLLRQSVEKKTTGPILWYGSYVDFGAFSEALNNNIDKKVIYFDFNFFLEVDRPNYNYFSSKMNYEEKGFDVKVKVGVKESNKKTVADSLCIEILGESILVEYPKPETAKLYYNSEAVELSKNFVAIPGRGFLPLHGVVTNHRNGDSRYKTFDRDYIEDHFYSQIAKTIRHCFHSNKTLAKIEEEIRRLGVLRIDNISSSLISCFNGNKKFEEKFRRDESLISEKVFKLLLIANFSTIVDKVSREIERTFSGVRYIAPLRATAERYYRHQDLQVEEIDHTGSNLAVLLRSFSPEEMGQFSDWTKEKFNFSVRVDEQGLHYELKILLDGDDREYNITDMGFGFSQILPIVASVWIEASRRRRRKIAFGREDKPIIFAIEQPELHLHPEFQSRLSVMFAESVSLARKNGLDLRIVFETHSKTMIDAIGDCVESKTISSDDICIALFSKNNKNHNTEISFSRFDDEGYLSDWPVGFFSGR